MIGQDWGYQNGARAYELHVCLVEIRKGVEPHASSRMVQDVIVCTYPLTQSLLLSQDHLCPLLSSYVLCCSHPRSRLHALSLMCALSPGIYTYSTIGKRKEKSKRRAVQGIQFCLKILTEKPSSLL